MLNKLPEKLTYLRKYFQFAQGDIAAKLDIPVTEYMKWENGSGICTIRQLKMIADLYHVSLDELADNTKRINLPEDTMGESIQIPFMEGADINQTQVVEDEQTKDHGNTKTISTVKEVPEEEKLTEKPKKHFVDLKKKKLQSGVIIGGVAVAVVVVALLIFILTNGGSQLSVSNLNRLALGDTYSLYVEQGGNVKIRGDFDTENSFRNAVQVSAYRDHAVFLQSNGKIVTTDANIKTDDWKDVKAIAAGANHVVAVTNEGKVLCEGSENACKVSNWANIASVYAGNEITVGLSNDGSIYATGENASVISGMTNVKNVNLSDTRISVTKKDGTVINYPIGSGTVLDTTAWTKIDQVVAGTDMIAGLTKDGTVNIICEDETIRTKVESWKSIQYIAAYNHTIIAIDKKGKMYGAGDNAYNQYVDEVEKPVVDKDDDVTDLEEPSNIQFTETTANIVIKWNTVENADYYEITMNTEPATETKTSSNSISVPTTSLLDGETYTLTITAKSDKEDKFKASTATTSYTYTAKTVQLIAPDGVTAVAGNGTWTISWSNVEHAEYYMISLDGGAEVRTDINTYTYSLGEWHIEEGTHNISIRACSSSNTYSDSDAGQAQVQYAAPTFGVDITFVDESNINLGTKTVQVVSGTYTYDDLARNVLPEGYSLVSPETPITITSAYGVQMQVKVNE